MAINLDNFVEINIKHALTSTFTGSRNICTLILFTDEFTESVYDVTYNTYQELLTTQLGQKFSVYINSFFNNAYNKNNTLKIMVKPVPQDNVAKFLQILKDEVDYTQIVIASNLDYATMKQIRQEYKPTNQIHEKIFLTYVNLNNNDVSEVVQKIENFVVKVDDTATTKSYPCVAHIGDFPTLYERIESYNLTQDVEIDPEKTYYTRSGAGTEQDPYVYTVVDNPVVGDIGTYYEKTITYVATEDQTLSPQKTYYYLKYSDVYDEYDKFMYEIVANGQTPGYLVDANGNQYEASNAAQPQTGKTYYEIDYIGKAPEIIDYSGIELTVGAYLTQINVNRYESIKDYCFTEEAITDLAEDKAFHPIDDNLLASHLMEHGYNFIGELVGKRRNLGGDDTALYSVVNQFMLICLAQELTERLFNLLVQKINYNTTGLNQISTTLVDTLQKYVNNGFLSTEKVWENEDLEYYGNIIIKKGTPLSMGYKVYICPFSTLTSDDYKKHKLPNIYVLVADSYGIRKIEVDGTTF